MESFLMNSYDISVSGTEIINLLLGNNNCTCIELERIGGLNFAFPVSDPSEVDLMCPIFGNPCYSTASTSRCSTLKINGTMIPPFFQICETPTNFETYTLCFGNVSEYLNGLRLQFFTSRRTICPSTGSYYATNTYIRSLELKGKPNYY